MEILIKKPKIFLTADTHFGHRKIIGYCQRPFASVHDHDEALIANWNSRVKPKDTVYHLGDFAFLWYREKLSTYASRLQGHIIFIFGNHDRGKMEEYQQAFDKCYGHRHQRPVVDVKIDKEVYIMSHEPLLTWTGRAHQRVSFFGHVHSGPKKRFLCQQNSYDIGVDRNEFTPILLEDAVAKARSPEGKFNFLDVHDEATGKWRTC